jgi:hypothetical protein
MVLSQAEAVREGLPICEGHAALSKLEQRLNEAVAVLLVGTDWECNGAVWTVEAAVCGRVRVGSGTVVREYPVGEWLGNPEIRRLPCKAAA